MNQSGAVVARHDYLPFGEEVPANVAGRTSVWGLSTDVAQKFTGQERDVETGLDHFGSRYYGFTLGRFSSPDPSALAFADPTNPQSFDLYSYGWNNPLVHTDPTGMSCVDTSNGMADDGDGQGCADIEKDVRPRPVPIRPAGHQAVSGD